MILFYFLLLMLVVSRIRFQKNGFYSDYLSFDTSNSVKGGCIALVFIKHVTPYILNSGFVFDDSIWSQMFLWVDAEVGQWIVAMFLFYSGYGLMESIQRKGMDYVDSIPRNRVLKTLVNFDIAVALFIIVGLFTPDNYSFGYYLLSFIGWESVGNSNWYIFVIMLCYLIAYVSFRVGAGRHSYVKGCVVCAVLLGGAALILSFLKQTWWYDTMFCFGLGVCYSILRPRIEPIAKRYYWLSLSLLLVLLVCLDETRGIAYNFYCIAFCLLVVMLTMKFKINNSVLIWAGKHLFPLYIYQRIPMIVLSLVGSGSFVSSYPVLYALLCLLITILFAFLYRHWEFKP